jgi:hypothetical protein
MEPPATFSLDARNARVSFSVRWFGIIHVRGWFSAVEGRLAVPGDGGAACLVLQVESASVRTGIVLRDRHLRGLRFLDSARHPFIRFRSERVTRRNDGWEIEGRLSLRGHERTVWAAVPDEPAAGGAERWLTAGFAVPRRPHLIGTARGVRRLNPLLWAIGDDVMLRVELLVPVRMLEHAAEHVPAR